VEGGGWWRGVEAGGAFSFQRSSLPVTVTPTRGQAITGTWIASTLSSCHCALSEGAYHSFTRESDAKVSSRSAKIQRT